MRNTGNKEYSSKREYAFDLFEENWSLEDVAEMLELTYNTTKTYFQLYKKEKGLVKPRVARTETVKAENPKESNSRFIMSEIAFKINCTEYVVDHYKDTEDGSIWFNFVKIIEAIKKEDIAQITDNLKIADRYFRNEIIGGSQIMLIDKNALLDLAKEIGDFTLISSVVDYLTSDCDYFYQFGRIVKSFKMMEQYLTHIEDRFADVKAYNDYQTDLLHEIDNNPRATKEERWERYEKIESVRHARRAVKNELVLSQSLRGLFKYHNVNARNIDFMNVKLEETLYALYHKNYNPRIEQLDEAQRELVEKSIKK